MNKKTPIIVANWKMKLAYKEAMAFAQQHLADLSRINTRCTLIICPSFESLAPIAHIMSNLPTMALGAQDCSAHDLGAHTGQVAALSLAQLGCTYCIVGHSERRIEYRESNMLIAEKAAQLLENNITPIICIGETEQEYKKGDTYAVLEQQLAPIIDMIMTKSYTNRPVCIAYEPVWAIGTGVTPSIPYLVNVFNWLRQRIAQHFPLCTLLYGGSITAETMRAIVSCNVSPAIDGFLVGSASVDFQKLKNIVSWCSQ